MKNILINELENILSRIKSDNSVITEEDQLKVINMLKEINSEKYNATQASKYLGVCRKTFDTYVKNGELPKGIKEEGGVNYWLKIDLEKWKQEKTKKI